MSTTVIPPEPQEARSGPEKHRKQQRNKYWTQFERWCEKSNATVNVQLLEKWDDNHNAGRFRALDFDDKEVWSLGLREAYTRIFYRHTMLRFQRPDGDGVIDLACVRKAGPGVGNVADVTNKRTTRAQRDYMIAKLEREIEQLGYRAHLLEVPLKQLLALLVEHATIGYNLTVVQ